MKPEISVQLYSVREEAAKGYEAAIRKIAAMGFRAVEPAGFPGSTPEEAGKLFKELGITAPSCHGGLPIGDDKNKVIEMAQAIGAKYIISGGIPREPNADQVKEVAERYSQAAAVAAEYGMQVGYHNHDWEMVDVDGSPVYRIFMDNTPESVLMQVDTYWVKVGGLDPVDVVKEVGARGKALHIKDGPGVRSEAMLAAGSGIMDFPPIVEAATFAELLVIELDRCDTDMMEAVQQSYDYLAGLLK